MDHSNNSMATDSPRDITNRNQPLLLFHIWIKQTPLYGQERVSLALMWCGAGLILSKSWVENQQWKWTPAVSRFSVATDSPRDNKQEPTTLILPYDASNKHHCRDKKEFHWLCGVVQG
jgi:hypothetical protein